MSSTQPRAAAPRRAALRTAVRRDAASAAGLALLWLVAMRCALALGWHPASLRQQVAPPLWAAALVLAGPRRPRTAFCLTALAYPLVLDPGFAGRLLGPGHGVHGMLTASMSGTQLIPVLLAGYQVMASGRARARWVLPVLGAVVVLLTTRPIDLLANVTGYTLVTSDGGGLVRASTTRTAPLNAGGADLSQLSFQLILTATCVLLGRAEARRRRTAQVLADRSAELERLREVEARDVVRAERTRIARELHDVVAHHVSAIVLRAQAADRVADSQPAAPREAVRWIAGAGQEALASMRQVVHVLRHSEDTARHRLAGAGAAPRISVGGLGGGAALAPDATLAELPDVAARVSDAGVPVELRLDGLPDPAALPPVVELAALRIVQESLTNVLLHSSATRAVVTVALTAGALVVAVDDDGLAGPPSSRDPFAAGPRPGGAGGNGLSGMRERVASCGGTVSARTSPMGGWRITAALPVRAGADVPPPAPAGIPGPRR